MANPGTMTAAFSHFDAPVTNPRGTWSARTRDGRMVVLALWEDRFDTTKTHYHERMDEQPPLEWINRIGNRNRREHLELIGVGGQFHVVMARAKSTNDDPRKGAAWSPRPDLRMRIIYIIKSTGQFGAEVVEGKVDA